ncbi:hypothetical protein GGQ85_003090 [Nitrobacter vulgaris]|nr:hypothetical protein [Nitrobacter vulgaris]
MSDRADLDEGLRQRSRPGGDAGPLSFFYGLNGWT